MDPQLKRSLVVIAAVVGVVVGWRQYSLYQMHKGYMGVAECVDHERRWGMFQNRGQLQSIRRAPALKDFYESLPPDPLAGMNAEQLELIAFRYCSGEKGWKSWLEYRKATAPADDRPEL